MKLKRFVAGSLAFIMFNMNLFSYGADAIVDEVAALISDATESTGCQTEHNWNEGEIIVEATCTEKGEIEYTCSECNETKTETISKLDHVWVEDENITEATCTAEGQKTYTCSECDEIKTETIDKLPHSWNEGEETVAATCTAEGETTYKCNNCDETKTETINKLPHNWNEGEVVTAATCTQEGEMKHICKECGQTKTETISKIPHNWNEGEIVTPATCTEKGELTYTCNDCEETKTETIDKLPHSWNEGEIVTPATCTAEGETRYTCNDCNEIKTETIEKLPHNWNEGEIVTPATCTAEGETRYTCNDCNETKTETIEKLPHNWNEGEIVTPATCTAEGETRYTCNDCNETKIETIEKLPHNWNEGEIVTEVSCTVEGETAYKCNDCDETKMETTEKLPHNWFEETVETATCTKEGNITYRCNECGQSKTETIEKLLHNWNEGEITTPATETTVGTKTYTCSECGQTKTEEIPVIKVESGATDISKTEDTNVGDDLLNVPDEQQPETPYLIIEPNGSTEYIEMGELISIITAFDEGTAVYYTWQETNEVTEDIWWTELEGTELEFEPYGEETYLLIKGTKNGEEIVTVSEAYLFDVEAFMAAWDVSTYEVESTALTISTPTIEYEGVIGSQKATVSFTISSTTEEEKVISLYKGGSLVSVEFSGFNATATGSQKVDVVVTEKGTYTIALRDSSGIKEVEFTVEDGPTFLEIATYPKTGYFLGDTLSDSDISSGTLNYGTTFGGVINATPISMDNSKVIVSTNAIDITKIGEYEVSVTYNDGTYSLSTSYMVTVADCVIFTPNGSETYMEAEQPIKVETDFDLGENIYYAWSYYKDAEKVTEWIPLTGDTVGLKPVGPENYLYIKGIKNGEEKIVRSERYLFFAPIKSLEIINLPKTTVYYVDKANNSLLLEGIKINLVYDMGEKDGIREVSYEELAAYSIELNTPTFAEGIEKITVSYTDRIVNEGKTVSDTFYITNNRSTNERDEVNKPQVTEGMLPIKWVEAENKWMITTEGDVEWYDYCAPKESYGADLDVYDNQHWANVMLRDDIVIEKYKTVTVDDVVDEELAGKFVETLGSMFVWIPRYSYSLTNDKLDGLGGADSASVTIPQSTLKTTVYTKIAWSQGTVDTLGNVSPAFSFNGSKINGFWIGKFEASKNADGDIKVLPDQYTFNYVSIEDAFDYAKDMMGSNKDYYQITQTNIDSHMTRNSEWGAVALLTNATADNGQTYTGAVPYVNNYAVGNPKTGYAGSTLDKGQVNQANEVGINTFAWDTKEGQKGSTTHNIYGVYDMSGGVGEYVSTYLTAQSPITNDSKYWEVFDVTKPGYAVSEVIISGSNGTYTIIDSDMAAVYSSGYPFIERGGSYYLGVQAGVFAFNSMNNSNIYQMSGFRPVIVITGAIEDTPIEVSYTFGTNNSSSSKLAKANDVLTVNISATDSINLAQSNVKIKTGGVEVTGTPVISGNLDSWKIEYEFLDTDTTGNVSIELNGSWTTLSSESTVYFSSSASNGNIITLIPSISGSDNVTSGNVDVEVDTGAASIVTKKYAKEETISSAIAPNPMTNENIIPYFADKGINITGKNFTVTENGTYYVYVEEQTGNKYIEKIVINNIDNIIPVLTITSIHTNNTVHTDYAKNGEKVTVEMEASEEIYTNTANGYNLPTVTIGGRDATVTWTDGSKTGKAEYTIPSSESSLTEGLLTMQIKGYQDKAKNFGTPLTITADKNGNTATYDRTKVQPAISTPSTLTTHGEEVTYTVSFSDNILIDQNKTNITTADFEIVTTGTVTGVIELVDTLVATEKSVKIKQIQGEGTFYLKVLGVNGLNHTPLEDMAGNKTAMFESAHIVNVDTIEPEFTDIKIETNNATNSAEYAKNGDTITLTLKSREAITTPKVTIMGRTATVTNPSNDHINFIATYTIDSNEVGLAEGQVTFEVSNYEEYDSQFINVGITHTETIGNGAGSKIIYDRTVPSITMTPSENPASSKSHTVKVVVLDPVAGLIVSNQIEYAWSTSNITTPTSWTPSTLDAEGNATITGSGYTGNYYLWIKTLSDKAGNTNSKVSGIFKFDNTAPEVDVDEGTSEYIINFESNNVLNSSFATNGNTLTLTFTSDEEITPLSVRIAGRAATIETFDNTSFTASYEIPSDEKALAEGDIGFVMTFEDAAGNQTTVNSTDATYGVDPICYDRTKPTVTFGTNGNKEFETTHSTTVTIEDTNLKAQTYYYAWADNNINEPTYTNTFTNGSTVTGSGFSGIYYLWIKTALDEAGNESGPVISNAFNFDNGTPIIEVTSIKSNNTNVAYAKDSDRVTLHMTSSEGLYTNPTITIGGKAATVNWTAGATVGTAYIDCDSTVAEGKLTVVVSGYKDVADNVGITVTVTEGTDGSSVIFDRVAPSISLSPNTNTTASKRHAPTLTVSDTNSGLESNTQYYAWSTSNTTTPTAWNPVSLASGSAAVEGTGLSGTYYLWIKAVADKAGNTSSKTSEAFNFDNSLPTLSVTIASNNPNPSYAKQGDRVTITMTSSEGVHTAPTVTIGGKTATVSWTAGATTGTAYVDCDTTIPEGVLSIRISGYKDSSGNQGDLITQTTDGSNVYYDKTNPYALSIIAANNANSVTLTGKASDNSKIVAYAWTKDTTTVSTWNTVTGTSDITQGYGSNITAAGTYYFHVKDIAGNTSSTSINVYSITYDDTDGEGAPATQYKAHGVELKLSDTLPTRVGYTFDAWRSEDPVGDTNQVVVQKLYSSGAVYEQNANTRLVVNEWVPNLINVQITHNLQNANDDDYSIIKTEKQTLSYGTVITLDDRIITEGDLAYTRPTKTYKLNGSAHTQATVTVPATDIIIEIYYYRINYVLTLVAGDYISAVTGADIYKWGQNVSITATVADSAAGYTNSWVGWTSSNSGLVPEMAQQNSTIVMPKDAITLTANGTRQANEYIVTFDATTNGGTLVGASSKKVIYDEPYGDMPTAIKTGYTFDGWYTAPSGGENIAPSSIMKNVPVLNDNKDNVTGAAAIEPANHTLYAHFTANTYYVAYDGNGATSGSMSNSTHTYGTAQNLTANAYSRTGYTFNGWKTDAGVSYANSASVNNLTIENGATVVMHAQWYKDVKITYMGNKTASYIPASVQKDVYNEAGTQKLETDQTKATYDIFATSSSFRISAPETSYAAAITSGYPTREGYTCIGWATSAGAQIPAYTAGGIISLNNDITLYAVWEGNPVTISFDATTNGGSVENTSKVVRYGDYYGDLPTPVKTGYRFTGWFTAASGGTQRQPSSIVSITSNETLCAQFTPRTYIVLLDAGTNYGLVQTAATEGEEEVAAMTVAYGASYVSEDNPLTPLTDETTQTYSLRSYSPVSTMSTLPTATRTGYTSTGWYTQPTGGSEITDDTTVTVDDDYYSMYAQYEPNTYTVTYNSNKPAKASGTITGSVASTTHTYDHVCSSSSYTCSNCAGSDVVITCNYISSNKYTLTGWTQTGWNTKADGTGEFYSFGDAGHATTTEATTLAHGASQTVLNLATSGNVTLYAVWDIDRNTPKLDAHTYTVTYNSNKPAKASGTVTGSVASTSHEYDHTSTLSSDKYRIVDANNNDTWTQTGWNTAADGSGTFYDFGSAGYATNGAGETVLNLTATNGGSVTLYAVWSAHTYTLIYNSNKPSHASGSIGGTVSNTSHTYDHTSTVSASYYTLTGWTQTGWNTKADGTGTAYSFGDVGKVKNGANETVINLTATNGGSVTLYAVWSANTYAVTLDGQGATSTNHTTSVTATYDSAMPIPITLPSRVYTVTYNYNNGSGSPASETSTYTFGGYYDATNGSGTQYYTDAGASARTWNKTANTTLYAKWTSARVTLPTATRTGYRFSGWSDGSSTYAAEASYTPTSNITLTATWVANTYTVTYNSNKPSTATGSISGTTADSSHTYDVAKKLTANGYSLTGWRFNGWNTAANGSGTAYGNSESVVNLTTTHGGTVTLYAQWVPNTYTVVYNGNGATSGSTANSTHTYDVAENLTANGYSRTGYNFLGWSTSSTATSATYENSESVVNLTTTHGGTVTLYAVWEVSWPTLKPGYTWQPDAMYLTETLTIQDAPYTGTYYAYVPVDVGETGSIKLYFTDSTYKNAIMAGNGSGRIKLNQDSSYMFVQNGMDGLNIHTINGLEVFETSEVTNMANMFYEIDIKGELDLSSFNTSNVTDMSQMFYDFSADTLDLSSFNTSSLDADMGFMSMMFVDLNVDKLILGPNCILESDHCLPTTWFLADGTAVDPATHTRTTATTYYRHPTIKPGDTWFSDYSYNKIGMTEMIIQDAPYTGTSTSSWPADIAETGAIMCYIVDDSKLIIAGNGSGKIMANADSSYMFSYFEHIEEIEGLSLLDTSNVKNMEGMFVADYILGSVDLSGFNTSNVTNMSSMFEYCRGLKNVNLSSFDVSKVEYMSYMFANCYELTSLDLSNFVTSNVLDTDSMFHYCESLETLDLRNFNTSKVDGTNGYMTAMFNEASIYKLILGPNFIFKDIHDLLPTTWYLENGTAVDPTTHTRTGVTTYYRYPMLKPGHEWWTDNFYIVETLAIQDAPYTGTSTASYNIDVDGTGSIKLHFTDTAHKNAIIAGNGSGKIKLNPNSGAMLEGCTNLTTITGIEVFDTSEVTNMAGMFDGLPMTSLDLSSFNTSNVTDMSYMFSMFAYGNLKSLDLRNFDTSKVTNMSNMFLDCDLEELTLGPNFTFKEGHGLPTTWFLADGTQVDITTHTRTGATTYYRYPMLKPGQGWLGSYSDTYSIEYIKIQTDPYDEDSDDSWPADVGDTGAIMTYLVGGNTLIIAGDGSDKIYANPDSSHMFDSNDDKFYNVKEIEGLSNLDTSKVTNMSHMFEWIYYLEKLDLSNFDTRNVTSMTEMFDYTDGYSFKELTLGPNFVFKGSDHGLFDIASTWYLENGTAVDPTTHTRTTATTYYSSQPQKPTPIINERDYWFDMNKATRTNITKITIKDSHTPSGSKISWDASANGDGSVMCYVDGTELIIAGNGSGYIMASPDCNYMFSWKEEVDGSEVFTFNNAFANVTAIEGLSLIDYSNATNVYAMFAGCKKITSLDVSTIDTSNVASGMAYMFGNCQSLTSITFGGKFTTSKADTMSMMFWNCSSLTSLNLSSFSTSAVTVMNRMFHNCSKLTTINFGSNFNTAKVTNMQEMFRNCSKLTSLNLSGFNTSKVTKMHYMFAGCTVLTSLDLSSFNAAKLVEMSNMFLNCGLEEITLGSSFNFVETDHGLATTWYLADGTLVNPATHTRTGTVTYKKTTNVPMLKAGSTWYNGSSGKYSVSSIRIQDSPDPGTWNGDEWDIDVDNTGSIKCYELHEGSTTTLIITGNGSGRIRLNPDSSNMFSGFTCLTSISGLDYLNTSEVTNMSGMFASCQVLDFLDLGNFNTSRVTNMSSMFANCYYLNDVDLSMLDTSKVTDMCNMFEYAEIDNVDLRISTASVEAMDMMFQGAKIETLTLGADFVFIEGHNSLLSPETWYLEDGSIAFPITDTRTEAIVYYRNSP
ncbi:MAG: BspA family leucine-rich repeat surface protein [Clostridiales bacterium]|nr:BspA family leucine-rich repeat surface protein [Clostridiales bacterium]